VAARVGKRSPKPSSPVVHCRRVSVDVIVAAPSELARVFAERVASAVHAAQAARETLSLVLPGGSVAETFFPVLARAPIAWDAVDLFWGDERAVASDSPDSNYHLAAELLLSHVDIDPARVHRMPAERPDLAAAAVSYEDELTRVLGDRRRFDIVLLGVGPDGHVCSLFPRHAALAERTRLVVPIVDSPKPPPRRLTLTMPALVDAVVVVAAFDAAKANAITDALENPASDLPVAIAVRGARDALFLLGSDLRRQDPIRVPQ
jgi:6-phosphogluconolactonase